MSTTVGRVDFLVDFDGKKLPAQARTIGREVGSVMGRSASDSFDNEMSGVGQRLKRQMQEAGEFDGITFAKALEGALKSQRGKLTNTLASIFSDRDAFNDFVASADNVDDGLDRVNKMMLELRDSSGLTWNEFQSLNKTTREWGDSLRDTEVAVRHHREALVDLDKQTKELDLNFNLLKKHTKEMDSSNDESGGHWKDLSFNLRQAIVIIGAIAAGSGEIAVLGSAAGAGLTIFAGAALAAGAGLAVLVAGLSGLGSDLKALRDLDKLLAIPAADRTPGQIQKIKNLQDVIKDFDSSVQAVGEVGSAFKDLQTRIQVALLDGATPVLQDFIKLIEGPFGDGVVKIASALNDSLLPLIEGLSSDAGGAKLEKIFGGMADQVEDIVQSIGFLGSAIGNLLIVAEPFITAFTAGFKDMLDKFDQFTGSVEGNKEITEFLENGTFVLGKFVKLVGAAGKLLSGLVDDKSVKQTGEFLDNLSGAMVFLQDLLEVFSDLDLFGLAAQLLNDVGNALKPILDALQPIATIINEGVKTSIQQLGIAIEIMSIPLQLLEPILNGIAIIFTGLAQYARDVFEALEPLIGVFGDVGDTISEKTEKAFKGLLDKILELLPKPEELAKTIKEVLLPKFEEFADWLTTEGVDAIQDMVQAIEDFIDFTVNSLPGLVNDFKNFVADINFYAKTFTKAISGPIGAIQALIDIIDRLNNRKVTLPTHDGHTVGGGFKAGGVVGMAEGGIANSMRWLSSGTQVGESGPEAIVPLMRDLNQVDPSVRWLSALAQGKELPGGGKVVNVEKGAILVVSPDPELAADAVLDRFVAKVGN